MSKRVYGEEPAQEEEAVKGTARAYCYTFFLGENCRPVPCGIDEGDAPDPKNNRLHARLRYFICQREVCPETSRIHWQAYGEFNSPVKWTAVFSAIRVRRGDQRFVELRRGEVHVERRRGRRDQARDYCRKQESRDPRQDSGPFEFGTFQDPVPIDMETLEILFNMFLHSEIEWIDRTDGYSFVCATKL